jgi:hypothetical protein
MCPPALIVGGVVAATKIGGAIASHSAQKKASKANAAAAREAYANAVTQANALRTETQDKATRSFFTARRQARQARSQAATVAGESGVAGRSAEAIADQVTIDLAEFGIQTERQKEREVGQIERDLTTGEAVKRQRIAAQPPPNPFATGLNIVGAVAEGYGAYKSLR